MVLWCLLVSRCYWVLSADPRCVQCQEYRLLRTRAQWRPPHPTHQDSGTWGHQTLDHFMGGLGCRSYVVSNSLIYLIGIGLKQHSSYIKYDTNSSTDWTIFSNVQNLVMSTECPRSRGLLSLEFISKGSVML